MSGAGGSRSSSAARAAARLFRRPRKRAMTSQGSAHGRFTRAVKTRNLWAAETAMREMGAVSLLDALDCLDLLAAARPDRFDRAAVRWHGRLETEA